MATRVEDVMPHQNTKTQEVKTAPVGECTTAQAIVLRKAAEEPLSVLLDTGAQTDVISHSTVQRLGLQPATDYKPVPLEGFQGEVQKPVKAYWLTFFLLDRRGLPRKIRRVFSEARTRPGGPDIILSRPSMGMEGIIIDTATNTFYYGGVADADAESFLRDVIEDEEKAYILHISAVLTPEELDFPTLGEETKNPGAEEKLPEELQGYEAVFDEQSAKLPPMLEEAQHAIDLEPDKKPPWGPLYPLNEKQYEALKEYILENLANGRIRHSKSEAGAPVLFVPKKDGTLRLCVDYRGLNKVTVKNRYPLPLIGDLLDRLAGAKWISKVDIRDAYHRINIKESDKWKTAFRTRYGHFEYNVMPFGLTNAPATFQAYVHRALSDLLDTCCIAYMDDVLIFSKDREQHTEDLKKVLQRLQAAQLYAKRSKCEFYQQRVEFLGYVITAEGVEMDRSRVQAIEDWKTPECYRDIQVFLGFCNFYRKFIAGYSGIVSPLTALLKGSENGKKSGEMTWTEDAEEAFQRLKSAFCSATVLRHWDPKLPTRVETDASVKAIAGILTQLVDTQWRPVAYYSRKLTETEQRWGTGQQELLAIIESLEHWGHYLQGLSEKFQVLTDHQALKGVVDSSARDLRGRLARWVYRLSAFDFDIEHRPGKSNPADGLSRRPDYMLGEITYEDVIPTLSQKLSLTAQLPENLRGKIAMLKGRSEVARAYIQAVQACAGTSPSQGTWRLQNASTVAQRAIIAATTTRSKRKGTVGSEDQQSAAREEPDSRRLGDSSPAGVTVPEQYIPRQIMRELTEGETAHAVNPSQKFEALIQELQIKDRQCQEISGKCRIAAGEYKKYTISKGLLWFKDRLVIPEEGTLRLEILRRHHDDPRAGHMGPQKTLDLVKRKFHWSGLAEDVRKYTDECEICQGVRTPRHRPYGHLQSLPLPLFPFQEISLDFITGLPQSTRCNGETYNAILVIVCRMTKFAMFIPTQKTLRATDLAALLYEHVECRFGTPEGIISDRDKLITSHFWEDLMKERAIKRRLSTAYHPQTDGQTERTHQTLEKYLRAYVGDAPERWAAQLDEAAFAYNNSKHSTIGVSPMEALYGYHPRCVEYVPSSMKSKVQGVRERIETLRRVRDMAQQHWQQATEAQAKYYNARHTLKEYQVGQYVGVSTRNWRFKNRKLAPKYVKVKITERIGKQAYRVSLPKAYERIHDVFHVSLLEPWNTARPHAEQSPTAQLEDEPNEWEVEEVIAHKDEGDDRFYLVKWAGWPVEYNTWEPDHHLSNAKGMVAKYLKVTKKQHKKWDD